MYIFLVRGSWRGFRAFVYLVGCFFGLFGFCSFLEYKECGDSILNVWIFVYLECFWFLFIWREGEGSLYFLV